MKSWLVHWVLLTKVKKIQSLWKEIARSFKTSYGNVSLFVMPLVPVFWTFEAVVQCFKTRVDSLVLMRHHLNVMDSSESLLTYLFTLAFLIGRRTISDSNPGTLALVLRAFNQLLVLVLTKLVINQNHCILGQIITNVSRPINSLIFYISFILL